MSLQPQTTIVNGKYHILRLIGKGGMARVWLAREVSFGYRPVAIKEPHAGLDSIDTTELLQRFQREVKISAELVQAKTPNIVQAITAEPYENGLLLVLEYMIGGDLEQRIRLHPQGMPIDEVVAIARDVLIALAAIHRHPLDIVHRDIKPSNILFDERNARVSDFGLAQVSEESIQRGYLMGRTHPGTPLYCAPEQLTQTGYVTPAADVYAFGAVLFEMLTGKKYKTMKPDTRAGQLRKGLPVWLDDLVARATAEEPQARWKDAGKMLAELESHFETEKRRRKNRKRSHVTIENFAVENVKAEKFPRILGKYEIIEILGEGGFATVYRAHDRALDRDVAIKILAPILMRDPVWVRRFQQEARAVAKFKHPHIIRVLEIDQFEGALYIAMELAESGSLDAYIRHYKRLSWRETLRLAQEIADALDYAHGKGVLHLDLKPANILLDPSMGALLSDFGFARMLSKNSLSYSIASKSGGIIGTPSYMAPEIWKEEPLGPHTDIYAFGCIVFEMLTGEKRFTGGTTPVIMHAHFEPPPFPEKWADDVPSGVQDVLDKAMYMNPAQRFPTAHDFVVALQNLDASTEKIKTPQSHHTPTTKAEQADERTNEDGFSDGMQSSDASPTTPETPIRIPSPHIAVTPIPQEPCHFPEIEVTLPVFPHPVEIPANPLKNPLYYAGIGTVILIAIGYAFTATTEFALLALLLAGGVMVSFAIMVKTKENELRSKYHIELERRRQEYLRQIDLVRENIVAQRISYKNCLLRRNPSPDHWVKALEGRNFSELWTRIPVHQDFLDIRIGMGAKPFPVTFHTPNHDSNSPDPELLQAVHSLQQHFQNVSDIPLTIPIKSNSSIVVLGGERTALPFLNAFITHIAVQHSPMDVKILILRSDFADSDWTWMRWLPHVWSDDRQIRYITTDLVDLEAMFHQMTQQSINDNAQHFILLTNDPHIMEEIQKGKLFTQKTGDKITGILQSNNVEQNLRLPCTIVDLRKNRVTVITDAQEQILYDTFTPDIMNSSSADRLARMMAPIRLKSHEAVVKSLERSEATQKDKIFRVTLNGDRIPLTYSK